METFHGHRRQCHFYLRGYCKRGKDCKFAHHQVLKPPGDFDIRRSSSNAPSSVPLALSPDTREPEKGCDWIAQESELSRNNLAPLKREESSEFEKIVAKDRRRESSGNACESRQSLPDPHVDDTEQKVHESSQDSQDSQSTESDRSVKRLVIVPVTLCLLVPDMTGLTEQRAASIQTEKKGSTGSNSERSTSPPHELREPVSISSDDLVFKSMQGDELAKTALSAYEYVFSPVHKMPVPKKNGQVALMFDDLVIRETGRLTKD